MRLVGNGFSSDQTHQLYLNDEFLKSAKSDSQGNFITTIKIPDSIDVGINKFKIINELGSSQISSIKINEQKNRLIKVGQVIQEFKINDIPASVNIDETLSISGVGQPSSPVIITIKNEDAIETIQVVAIGVNGEWNFQKPVTTDEGLGERAITIRNGFNETSKNVNFVTSQLFTISVFTSTTDFGGCFCIDWNSTAQQRFNTINKKSR